MEKVSKNYYRDLLKELVNQTNGKPMLFSGRYKYCENVAYLTFTCVRPVLLTGKSKTICNHVNIPTNKIIDGYHLTEKEHNRKFYFIGYPHTYNYRGEKRGCIKLEYKLGVPALFIVDELKKYITKEVKEKLFFLSDERYLR